MIGATSCAQRAGRALLEAVHLTKAPAKAVFAPHALARIVSHVLRELVFGPPQIRLQLLAAPTHSASSSPAAPIDPQRA